MDDLVVWLRQQIDEDERVAREAADDDPPPWHIDKYDGRIKSGPYTVVHIEDSTPRPPAAEHIARHDPARVLRQVAAGRLLLDLHKHCDAGCYIVKVLALPYSGRPGYREEEWKP